MTLAPINEAYIEQSFLAHVYKFYVNLNSFTKILLCNKTVTVITNKPNNICR